MERLRCALQCARRQATSSSSERAERSKAKVRLADATLVNRVGTEGSGSNRDCQQLRCAYLFGDWLAVSP